jgi:hypothetical protein
LHFNRVALVEGVVENTGSVNDLPLCIHVVAMTNKQILSCESIRLHVNISIGHIVYKR